MALWAVPHQTTIMAARAHARGAAKAKTLPAEFAGAGAGDMSLFFFSFFLVVTLNSASTTRLAASEESLSAAVASVSAAVDSREAVAEVVHCAVSVTRSPALTPNVTRAANLENNSLRSMVIYIVCDSRYGV